MARVSVESLSKQFGRNTVVRDVSFEVPSGRLGTILGPSGSGKTTILRCIAGVENPDSGTIYLGDTCVFSKSQNVSLPPERRNVGMVYQSYALWPHMTVYENIAYPLRIRRKEVQIEKRMGEVLEMLRLADFRGRHPYQLSGGEQQRVALARALVYDPAVLLLDEPFSNLDTPLRERLRDELKLVQRQTGITMIYVTHHRIEALSLSDIIMVLSGGQILAKGPPSELFERPPNSFVASFLAGMLIVEAKVLSIGIDEVVLQSDLGQIKAAATEEIHPGQVVKVAMLPSSLQITRGPAAAGDLEVKVTGLVFRSPDTTDIRVGIKDQVVNVPVPYQEASAIAVGTSVFLRAKPFGQILLIE